VLCSRRGWWLGSALDRGGVFGVVHAELALVVEVEVVLAVGPFPVLLAGLCLVGADRLGDLGPRRPGLDGLVDVGGMR
jgi:hypothetical protein